MIAIEHFFADHEELTTAEGREIYVGWAVPDNHFGIDRLGRKKIIPPEVYPYMWKQVVEMESGKLVSVSFPVRCNTDILFIAQKRCLSASMHH